MNNVVAVRSVPAPEFLSTEGGVGDPQVILLHPSVVRRQRRIAFGVIAIPALGTLCAVALAWREGITLAELVILVIMYSFCQVGISVGFHRYFTHHAFKT